MHTRQLFAAAFAFAAMGAIAQEATQFEVPPSTLTRAEVKAELARAIADGSDATDEASQTVQAQSSTQRREHARAQARDVERQDAMLYLGE